MLKCCYLALLCVCAATVPSYAQVADSGGCGDLPVRNGPWWIGLEFGIPHDGVIRVTPAQCNPDLGYIVAMARYDACATNRQLPPEFWVEVAKNAGCRAS